MVDEKELKVRIPVVPELDKRAVSTLRKDLVGLTKDLNKVGLDYKQLAKISQMNVKELKNLSEGAKSLGKNLSAAAQKAYADLGKTTKKIDSARQKASKFEKESASAGSRGDKPGQDKAQKGFERITGTLSKLNRELDRQKKIVQQHDAQTKRGIKVQQRNIAQLQKAADFGPKDAIKGVFSGLGKAVTGGKTGFGAGLKEAGGAAAKGVGGVVARGGESRAAAAGAEGPAMMAQMGTAMGAIAGVGVAFGVFIKMLMMASEHMTKLNKALIAGTGLANDFAMTGAQYRDTVDSLRQAAMTSHGALLRFGMDSEGALQAVNAFGKAATGSLGQTRVMLEEMGRGDLAAGMQKFAKNAKVYGAALGLEATEVAKMMGDMVSEIGNTGEGAMQTMQNLVKEAQTSGMPVQKFMDVFSQVLPSIDLFTNRIEQLTGTIKLLSKTMSPRDVKSFMQAMGKGFDEMDFKQRMKMAFVIGPKKVADILKKDFMASGDAIASKFGALGDEVKSAMGAADPVKAMAAVAAKATAMGVTPAAIGDAQKLARDMASLKKGDVLHIATAMRGAGMFARMKLLEAHAGAFTGGDISGLGEYASKQLGISEQEYKAILSLKDNMAAYQSMLSKTGKTSSKSMNTSLLKIWKQSKKQTELDKMTPDKIQDAFEQDMKDMATKRPKEMEDMIMRASAEQQAETEDQKESMEDLAAEQYNVQASIDDKLKNIVGYWLEKIFGTLQPILNVLDDLFSWFTGDDKEKKAQVVALKKSMDLQIKDANTAAENEANNLKDASSQEKDALSGMTQILKEAASTQTDSAGMLAKLAPILDQAGNMSLEAFDAQKKNAPGGAFFRDDPNRDIGLRLALSQAKEARSMGSKGAEETARAEAKRIVKEAITSQITRGKTPQAMYQVGGLAGALARSGVNIGGPGDPRATTTAKKGGKLASAQGDVLSGPEGDKFLRDMGSAAVVGASRVPSVTGGGGAAATKDAARGQQETAKVISEHADTAKQSLTTSDDIYQGIGDVLALLKKGVIFENAWMTTKLKTMLDKVVLDNVQEALFSYALLTDPDKFAKYKDDMAGAQTGAQMMKRITTAGMKDVGFAGGGYTGDGPRTKPAGMVHRGEFVVPQRGALVSGGKTVNVGTVSIHIQTNDPHEIRRVVDDIFNHGH